MGQISTSEFHRAMMRRAIQLAKRGEGKTTPNPCVGAVVVKNKTVIGKGYHQKAGGPHAEVNALADAGVKAHGADLYVTLEPCNHQGKTPPCTKAILDHKIRRVFVGMADPNPHVAGGGNDFLRSHGVEVQCNILEEQCRLLNQPFLKHSASGLPLVIMKGALSLDGKIATHNGQSRWITNESARRNVHALRNKIEAICVGIGTVLADDPSLTTRKPGEAGHDPLRVILDPHLRMPLEAKMLSQESNAPTWIFCKKGLKEEKKAQITKKGAAVHEVDTAEDGQIDLKMVLAHLGKNGIQSLLVEGGGTTHGYFLKNRLYDQLKLYYAPLLLGGDGINSVGTLDLNRVAEGPRLVKFHTRRIGDNFLVEGYFRVF